MVPLDLPPGLRGRARLDVARRQIADLLGAEAERLEIHPAPLPDGTAAWTRVILADRARLVCWRAATAGAGPDCRALLPDYLALPAAENTWTLAVVGDDIRARLGPAEGFTAERALARHMLETAIATGTPPARVLWSGDADPAIAAMLAARGIAGAAAPDPLAVSGSFAHGELQLDLSQDTAAAVEALRRALLPWRLPAAMVLVALVLWSAGMSAEIGGLRAEARAQRSAAEEIARIALLPAGPILDLRAQIARATATLDDAQDEQAETVPPLETLRRAGAVLAGDAAEVARVSLRPGAGLLVDLELADFAALDGLVGALRASGLTPRVAQSGTREGGQVQATLMLGTGDRPAVTGGTAQ